MERSAEWYKEKLLEVCRQIHDMSEWEDYPKPQDVLNLMDEETKTFYEEAYGHIWPKS